MRSSVKASVPDKSPEPTPQPQHSAQTTPLPDTRENTPNPGHSREFTPTPKARSVGRAGSPIPKHSKHPQPRDIESGLERQKSHVRNNKIWLEPSPRERDASLEISYDDPSLNDPTWADTSMAGQERSERDNGPRHIVKPSASNQSVISNASSYASTLSLSEEQKTSVKNTCLLIVLGIACITNITMASIYTANSGSSKCEKDVYTLDLDVYLFVAGITSGGLFILSGYAWWKGNRPKFKAPEREGSRKGQEKRRRRRREKEKKKVQEPSCAAYFHGVCT